MTIIIICVEDEALQPHTCDVFPPCRYPFTCKDQSPSSFCWLFWCHPIMLVWDGISVSTDHIVGLISTQLNSSRIFVGLIQCNSNLPPFPQTNAISKVLECATVKSIWDIGWINWGLESRKEAVKEPLRNILFSKRLCQVWLKGSAHHPINNACEEECLWEVAEANLLALCLDV